MDQNRETEVINPEVAEFEELYGVIADPRFKRIRDKIKQDIARLYRDVEVLRKKDLSLDNSLAMTAKEHRIDELTRLNRFFDSIIQKKNTPTGE